MFSLDRYNQNATHPIVFMVDPQYQIQS